MRAICEPPPRHYGLVPKKHKLKVYPGGTYVYFQCENCIARLAIERKALKRILLYGDRRLVVAGALTQWSGCPLDPDHPPLI